MIGILAALALACAEPDGGSCAQQINVGPFNENIMNVEGGVGQYTTYLWQSPGTPGVGCVFLTKYISVCSCFSVSPLLSGGNGGSLCFYNGNHRAFLFSDWQAIHPDADDSAEIGYESSTTKYFWKRVTSYENVVPSRPLTCSAQTDGGCFTDAAPRGSSVHFECPGPGTCEWAPGSSYLDNVWQYSKDGMHVCVTNKSEYLLTVKDDPGSVELDGDFVGGRWSSLCFDRIDGRWVEQSRKVL